MASTLAFKHVSSLYHQFFVPNLTRYMRAVAQHNSICEYQGVDCITLYDDLEGNDGP